MEKNKKTSRINFNPSNYDYIDESMPLSGWIWEFMRRSQEYRDAYESFQYMNSSTNRLCPQCQKVISNDANKFNPFWGINPNQPWSDAMKPTPWVGQPILNKINPVIVVNMKKGSGLINIPKRQSVEVDFLPVKKQESQPEQDVKTWQGNYGERDTYIIDGPHCTERREAKNYWVITHGPDGTERREPAYEGGDYIHIDHPLELVYRNQGRENVLMTLIDVSAPGAARELAGNIEREITSLRMKLGPRKRAAQRTDKKINKLIGKADIRKSYLIVFDLITGWPKLTIQPRTREEVSSVLSVIEEDFYATIENIKNHYNEAASLVNGGYRQLF